MVGSFDPSAHIDFSYQLPYLLSINITQNSECLALAAQQNLNYAGIHGGTNCYGGNLYPNVIKNESGVGTCNTTKRPDGIFEEIGGSLTNSISVYRLPGREDFKYIGCVKWNSNHVSG